MERRTFLRTLVRVAAAAWCISARQSLAEAENQWLETPIKRQQVESSHLASIGYSRAIRVLEVEFRSGALYRYREVPIDIYESLLKGDSKGRYFSQAIRGCFVFRCLKNATP